VESLTVRAERALLGAMIEDPGLAGRLGYLRPADFEDAWHRSVYLAILGARRDHPPVTPGWREAIIQAGGPGAFTQEELDSLVRDCPHPGHGAAYGAMVVQVGAVWVLRRQARELAARARQLSGLAQHPAHGQTFAGLEAGRAARHLDKVAAAIREHAAELGPSIVHAALPGESGIAAARVQREELVLAALLKPGRTLTKAMAEHLPAEAFQNAYQRAVFEVLMTMRTAGRPIDSLTADWELADAGLPLYEPGVGADGVTGETFAARLAAVKVIESQAIKAVSELRAEQAMGDGRQPVRGAPSTQAHGQRRGRGGVWQVPPRDPETTRPLRLVQRPPGRNADGPDRGPQQAR
jgi:hypothetical protein